MSADALPGAGLLDRIGERANPVLVKEVRAALRGRSFAAGFLVVLALALVSSTIAMLVATAESDSTPSGIGYLISIALVFGLGAHGLVPFSAMASMSAEHDEGALELLQMSGIGPGRLVLGKLGAAAVQAALIFAACLPFLCFAFLLQGVDLALLAGGGVACFAVSIAFSAFGILLGAVLRVRWQRVLGYVILGVALMTGVQMMFAWIAFGFVSGGGPTWKDFLLGLAATVLATAFCCVLAASRLQHEEENRSTAFRILGTAALLVACGFGVASGDRDETFTWLLVGLGLGVPSMLLGVTEVERMPRAVLARARRRNPPAWCAPWLPGGGRAVLLVLVDCALVLAAAFAALLLASGPRLDWWRMLGALAIVEAWLAFILLVPAGLLARWLDRRPVQVLARGLSIAAPIVVILGIAFVRFLSGSPTSPTAHVGNPMYLAERAFRASGVAELRHVALLAVAALAIAVGIHAPRILRSLGEVRRARGPAPNAPAEATGAQARP